MRIVAIDLEGTGPQDADDEAILEIALVSLAADLEPELTSAFTTLLNPGRLLSERTWIPPGITDTTLTVTLIEPEPKFTREATWPCRLVTQQRLSIER